jgi:hypothetical protein
VAEDREHYQQDDDSGHRLEKICESHRGPVNPSAEVSGHHSHQHAEGDIHSDGLSRDQKACPPSIKQTGQDVPSELIGAQPVLGRRTRIRLAEILQ